MPRPPRTLIRRLLQLAHTSIVGLSLLTACATTTKLQQAYFTAQQEALRHPAPAYTALGLRFGMDSTRVRQQLDALRQRDELGWQLGTHQLPIQFAEPQYVRNHLVRLDLKLAGSGLASSAEYGELLRGLSDAYGTGYDHSPGGEGGVHSWFKGGEQVRLMTLSGMGYALDFIDLTQAHALTQQQLRQDRAEIRQMRQQMRRRSH